MWKRVLQNCTDTIYVRKALDFIIIEINLINIRVKLWSLDTLIDERVKQKKL